MNEIDTEMIVGVGCQLAIIACLVFCFVRRVRRARREKAELRKRIQDAIANITADGRIERPKGRYKPRNWARKWVRYANALPAPRRHYEVGCRDLPDYPRRNER